MNNMIVELPCKIGDWVWMVRRYCSVVRPTHGKVREMYFTNDMKLRIVVKSIGQGEWGKQVFATEEEALASIK